MRRLKFLIITLASFLALVGGSIFKKALSLLLCGLLGFNSLVCSANFNGVYAQATLPPDSAESRNAFPGLVSQQPDIYNRCPQGTRGVLVGETTQFRFAICRGSAGEYYLGEDKRGDLGSILVRHQNGDPQYSYRRGQYIYRLRFSGDANEVYLEILEGSRVLDRQLAIDVNFEEASTAATPPSPTQKKARIKSISKWWATAGDDPIDVNLSIEIAEKGI